MNETDLSVILIASAAIGTMLLNRLAALHAARSRLLASVLWWITAGVLLMIRWFNLENAGGLFLLLAAFALASQSALVVCALRTQHVKNLGPYRADDGPRLPEDKHEPSISL